MSELMKFDFAGHNLSAQVDENSQGLFLAKDLCECLGLKNVSMAMKSLDDDEKLMSTMLMSGQNRDAWFVTEAGAYKLAILSRTEKSREFKRWLAHDVIPAIRSTGAYVPENLPKHMAVMNKDAVDQMIEQFSELREQAIEQFAIINKAANVIRHYKESNSSLIADNRHLLEKESLREQVAKKGTPLSEKEKELAKSLFLSHWSIKNIAMSLNRVTDSAIRSYIKKVKQGEQ